MKLRWPVYSYQCDECGHRSWSWRKPWYTPQPLTYSQELMINAAHEGIFSKDALALIGKTYEIERDAIYPWSIPDVRNKT